MNLKQAVQEQWNERFKGTKKSYSIGKIKEVKSCKNMSELLYHCYYIDEIGKKMIGEKIQKDFIEFMKNYVEIVDGSYFDE